MECLHCGASITQTPSGLWAHDAPDDPRHPQDCTDADANEAVAEPLRVNLEHHFEVVVSTTRGKPDGGVWLNGEHSGTWWDGTIWDPDTNEWMDEADGDDDASRYLENMLKAGHAAVGIARSLAAIDEWNADTLDIVAEKLQTAGLLTDIDGMAAVAGIAAMEDRIDV